MLNLLPGKGDEDDREGMGGVCGHRTELGFLVKRCFPDAEPCDWKRGERRKRLFVRACLNRIWPLLPEAFRAACELLDPDFDGQGSGGDREGVWSAAEGVSDEHDNLLFALGYDDIGLLCHIAAEMAAKATTGRGVPRRDEASRRQQEHQEQASLLRDIFGNPFRAAAIDPAWRTPTVAALAHAGYDNRTLPAGTLEPARLAVLADALEEAGCDSTDILTHCRQPGGHVRGCWLIDLLLGKSGLFEYRVTKYDPALRDAAGRYLREEWTSAGGIGRPFGGVVLTPEEYRRVEDAHAEAALAFLREAGCGSLLAVGVENHGGSPSAPDEGESVSGPRLEGAIRGVLREEFWCRLEGDGCFLHFGWDYYLYVGVPSQCPAACLLAARLGLFVEEFASPYREHG